MVRRDNIREVQDVRKTLELLRKPMFESFVMGEQDTPFPEENPEVPQQPAAPEENNPMESFDGDVKAAIVQIRKISIGIIAKLADNPTSESYTFMKRVLDMSDKALESMQNAVQTTK